MEFHPGLALRKAATRHGPQSSLRSDASTVPEYLVASQDLNPLENVWGILKGRLDETMPEDLENREAFIKRLRVAVAWVNGQCKDQLAYLEGSMQQRCQEALKKKGGRTSW